MSTDENSPPLWAGYLAVAISGLCFGSNFVPVKWYSKQVGDGLFFQWMNCCAVWFIGFIVFVIRGFPRFEPLAMLGGVLWCTGNVMTVPIIQCVGLSMGMLLWSLANLLMGWASGRFGFFGLLDKQPVNTDWLNYLGAALAALSGMLFAFIKPNTKANIDSAINEDVSLISINESNPEKGFLDKLSPIKKRSLGVVMAIIAGLLYGTNFDPPQHLIDKCSDCSKNGMDYVFPHFCGIFISSTIYFLIYCVVKGNRPRLPVEVAFPAFLSGAMWGLADVCWFIANASLSMVITFPTVSILPGLVASLWGICVFHEIGGKMNMILFGFGSVIVIVSIFCTVVSKGGS